MGDEWLQRISRRKNIPYYFNPRTGVTQWTKPSSYTEETCRDEERAVSNSCEERAERSPVKKARTSLEPPVERKPSSIVNSSQASKPTSSKKCDQDTQASSSSKKSDQDTCTPAKSENEQFVWRVLKPRKRLRRKKKPSSSSDVPQKKFQEVKQSLPPDKSSSLKGPTAKCSQTVTVGTSAKCTQSVTTPQSGRKETACHDGRNMDVLASERNGEQKKASGYCPPSKERTVRESDSDTRMEVDLPLSTDGKVLVVVDTNVLINSLQYLETIKGKPIEDLGDVMLTIPWIVMQELDLLKGNNYVPMTPLSASARKALSFLHKNRTDPNIKGQSYHHFMKTVKEKDVKGTSDDKILHYCLQCKKKYPMNLVVLLSNDKNLCVKASFSGVPSSGDKNFLEEIKKQVRSHSRLSISSDDNELFSPIKEQPSSGRSSPEGAITCISPMECPSPEPFQSSDHGAFKGIKTTCKDGERTKTPSPPGKQRDANIISNQQVGKTESRIQERPSTSGSPCVSDQAKEAIKVQRTSTQASDPVAERKKKEKEFTSKMMAFLKLALAIVLRHEMMESYTDHWLEIVHKKPPWSLLDALQCIKKHYIAVFGLLLGRSNAEEVDMLISIVEKIGEDDSFTLKQLNSFLSATKAILMPLNKTAKYKDITMKCEDDIKRIYNQWKEMIKKDPQTTGSPVINQAEKITLKIEEKESVQEGEDMCVSPIATSSSSTPDLGLLIDNQEARRQMEERTEGDGMDGVTYCVLSAFEAIYIVLKYHRDVIVWSFKHLASGCPIEGLPTKDESLKYLALALPLIEAIVLSLQRLIGSCLPVPVVHCVEVVESLQAYVKTLKLDLDISGLCPEMLQHFIVTEDNRERLVVGSQQLSEVLQQLHECRVTLSQF